MQIKSSCSDVTNQKHIIDFNLVLLFTQHQLLELMKSFWFHISYLLFIKKILR